MAEDLANEIVLVSRGMKTMQIAIIKKRLDQVCRDYFVSGAEEGQIRRFTNFPDANNTSTLKGSIESSMATKKSTGRRNFSP